MIKQETFVSFKEFYDSKLSIHSNFGMYKKEFVFRGQSSDWKLIPTALRSVKENYKEQINYELNYLEKFLKLANQNGLKIPNDVNNNRISGFRDNVNYAKWLPDELEELSALAQHYGLPTRLLDWTYDINVAMYFASIGAIKNLIANNRRDDGMVIWACNFSIIEKHQVLNKENDIIKKPLSFVIPSYYNNPNLNAQKGVLTAWKRGFTDIFNFVEQKSLDELIVENYKIKEHILYKFIIPTTNCCEMYKYVNENNYNAARIFPGYEGIKASIYEEEFLEEAMKRIKNESPLPV